MNRIQQEWNSYLRDVIPTDAPTVQLTESKRAFYAGAHAAYCIIVGIGDDSIPEDQGVALLEQLRTEMDGYVRDVVDKKA